MRLIDADKINFKEVFGGQSDFAKDLRKATQELINIQPTAFDKEKVIDVISRTNSAITVGDKDRALYWMKKLEEIVEKG